MSHKKWHKPVFIKVQKQNGMVIGVLQNGMNGVTYYTKADIWHLVTFWCLKPNVFFQPTGRLDVRVHTATVLTSFGLNQPALISMGAVLLPKSYYPIMTVRLTSLAKLLFRQLLIYIMLSSCPDINQSGGHFRPCSCSSPVNISTTEIFCIMQSDVCALCSKQADYLVESRIFSNITKGKFYVTVIIEKIKRISAWRDLLAIEISDR